LKRVIVNGHGGVGGNDVNLIRLDRHAIGNFFDAHGGFLREEFSEHAVMGGVEMLHEDEGHAGIGGDVTEEFRDCFDSACGGANGRNQEVVSGILVERESVLLRSTGWLVRS